MEKFKEAKLGPGFCSSNIKQVKSQIDSSTTFSLIGLPGAGLSLFLKYLVCQDFAYFIHVDIYELTEINKQSLFQSLYTALSIRSPKSAIDLIKQCQSKLKKLIALHPRVVIVFNRFDQLKKIFDQELFNNLRSLRDIDRQKIIMIFAVNQPLYLLAPNAIDQGNIFMFSQTLSFQPYSKTDLSRLIHLDEPQSKISSSRLKKLADLSGGHYQLFKLLLKSKESNYLSNPPIHQQLEKISQITFPNQINIPLFKQYKKIISPLSLPSKEAKLFSLLKKNLGSFVSQEEIINTIWPDDPYQVSDWALNSLVYRLRKNLQINPKKYLIENYKKTGYRLTVTALQTQLP